MATRYRSGWVFLAALGAAGAGAPPPQDAGADGDASADASSEASVETPPAPAAAADASAPPATVEAGPGPAKQGDGAAPDPLSTAYVHLFADYPDAVLELKSYVDDGEWKVACRAPCDQTLRVEGMDARVSARGMSTSNPFRIDAGRGTANLKVVGGSEGSRKIGTIGFAAGIPVSLLGMGLWGYGKVEDKPGLRAAGLVTLGVGAVMVLGSLPFLSAGSTRVRDAKGKTIAARFDPPRF
ncbi:MAG: hypothetical protein IT377_13945 [Polyangiaceae bacterium]|nr:hypothetical protein [Polyangiaceae bacterium]